MPDMRLAFYSGIIGDTKTGTGVHLTHLLRQMTAQRPHAEYISFVPSLRHAALHAEDTQRIDPAGHIMARTFPVPGRVLDAAQTYLHTPPMRLLLGQPYDIYHQMWVNTDPAVPSHKLVVTMHDTVSLLWPGQERGLFSRAGTLLRRAAAIITVSQFSKRAIADAFAVPPERIHTIYNGCDHDTFHTRYTAAETRAVLTELGVPTPYLFYIGGQAPRKNLPRLIAAFARARRTAHLPHTLVLAGPLAPLSPALADAIRESGCEEAIKVMGYVPDEAVPHLYRGAAALVFPSLYEGFGLPPVEAMACGTPVVTTSTSSLPEAAGDAGLLVDPESVEDMARGIIAIVSEDAATRAARVARGIAQAKRFAWERCAAEHLALYDRVIAQGRS